MPYQRGQFWIRRFRAQAQALCAALAALTQPTPAPDFVHRALAMLESTGTYKVAYTDDAGATQTETYAEDKLGPAGEAGDASGDEGKGSDEA